MHGSKESFKSSKHKASNHSILSLIIPFSFYEQGINNGDATQQSNSDLFSYMYNGPKSAYNLRRSLNQPMSAYTYA